VILRFPVTIKGGSGRLGRGKTGRAQKSRARANPKNMRKTTKRGAYKKNAKSQMVKRRAPLVETKKNVQGKISATFNPQSGDGSANNRFSRVAPPYFMDLSCYYMMVRGLEFDQMIGRQIFSKYLTLKGTIDIPDGNASITDPLEFRVIHGWLKIPTNFNTITTPTMANALLTDMMTHIKTSLVNGSLPLGDRNMTDKLEFPDKEPVVYKILKNQKVKLPSKDHQVNVVSSYRLNQNGTTQIVGASSQLEFKCKFPTMRKLHYDDTKASTGYSLANHAWLPFAYLYVPEEQVNAACYSSNASAPPVQSNPLDTSRGFLVGDIKLNYNACHWYTDG
jgi:hypothetical protein